MVAGELRVRLKRGFALRLPTQQICDTSVHVHVRVNSWSGVSLAAHFVNDVGLLDLRSRGLRIAKVGSCCVSSLLDDSMCPLTFHIAKVSHSPSHIHVRVTLVIRFLFAAHFADFAGLLVLFQVLDWNIAKVALPRDDGASSTALVIQASGVGQESWIVSAVKEQGVK